MKTKIYAMALAVVLACTSAGCAVSIDENSTVIQNDSGTAAVTQSESEQSSDSAVPDSTSEDEAAASETATTTTAVTTEAATVTTVFTGTPEDVDEASLSAHSVSCTGFTQVKYADKFEDCLDKLDEIAAEYGTELAFSYQNVDTGAQVNYNADKRFMTCSTIKVPYIKSILADGIDLDEIIVKDKNWKGDVVGEDYIASMDYGTEFTAKELIEAAVQRSDNTAYYLLEQYYGWNVFNQLQYEIGADYYVGSTWIFTYATSLDMLKSYVDVYEFGEESELGLWLTDLMTDTDVNMQIGKELSKKYKVSQKYGSEFNSNVFNDCAIVYADSPFVLCIMSNQPPETEESSEVFIELADIFDELNSLIYTENNL